MKKIIRKLFEKEKTIEKAQEDYVLSSAIFLIITIGSVAATLYLRTVQMLLLGLFCILIVAGEWIWHRRIYSRCKKISKQTDTEEEANHDTNE